jgi:hypothetical protein
VDEMIEACSVCGIVFRNAYKMLVGNLNEKDYLENIGANRRIILK